jgi:hypothetical protein
VKSKIEFLESVDIRKVWSKEDKNFTPWIANPEVMEKLLEQCGIDYDGDLNIKTEVTLPGYKRKLDVLVESTSGDRIAIENPNQEIKSLLWRRGGLACVFLCEFSFLR